MLQFQEQNKMGGEKFHTPKTELTFSAESVTLTLAPGEVREGTFTIYGNSNDTITGFVLSSRLCMKCLTTTFSGSRDEISYRFDGTPFSEGDTVDGYFRIISNQDEYKLPFSVKFMRVSIDSSLGPVRNLYHFTNLARTNWKEACDVFYHPAFPTVFTASEKKEKELYRGLSARPSNMTNVEEFLVAIHKKAPVEFIPEKTDITIDLPLREEALVEEVLNIKRNGWGYTKLDVYTEGSFLRIAKPELDAQDFREGSCDLAFGIDPEGLHAGVNLGRLILRAPFKEISIQITVRYCASTALRTIHHREQKRIISSMMCAFEDFRAKKLSGREFTDSVSSSIRKLYDIDRNNTYVPLYKIHYLLTAHKNDDALFELQNFNRKLSGDIGNLPMFSIAQYDLEDDVAYSYRMYLTILCCEQTGEDPIYVNSVTNDALRELEDRSKRNPDNFWILWLLLYATGAIQERPASAWLELRDQFDLGTRSPILYLEAYALIQSNPAIMRELGEFEQQTLLYAAKHGILTYTVMTQVNYLAQREKSFSRKTLRILVRGYEEEGLAATKEETLASICTILIRGNETDSRYFPWYQKGVDAQLSITRLFDYYMMSMPDDYEGEIPQMVIMYFAYQSSLPYGRKAYLYRYLSEHRDQYAEVYEQYRQQMDQFTETALLQHRMDKDLAFLYERYLTDGRALTSEIANAATSVIFTVKLTVTNPNVHRVVVLYERCREEQYYPITNGTCYLPIYGNDVQLFFEDDAGNRYASSVDYEISRMMDEKKLSEILMAYDTSSSGFDLYLSGLAGQETMTEQGAARLRRLADSGELVDEVRQQLQMKLLHYYHDRDDDRELDEYLLSMEPDRLDAEARAEVIQYMAIRGLNDKALAWLEQFGAFGVDGSALMRLCSRILYDEHIADDPAFSEIVHECFLKGKYDESLLAYMGAYFDGLTSELEEIRKACEGFGTDDYVLCRRMLIQILFTGVQLSSREEIIDHYMAGGADQELLSNAVAQSAHFYFTGDGQMSRQQFDLIAAYGREGVPIVDICRIAWLKDRAERSGEIADTELEVTRLFLQDLLAEGIIFPFFRQFIGVMPELQAYADETLVEYHAKHYISGAHILYHYAMEKNGTRDKYAAREMKEMYEGVYVTGFLLFFGEQMHYYITDDAAEKNVVESGTIGQDARIPEESDDRFGMINRISMLAALGRDEEALERISNYSHRAYLVKSIFEEYAAGEDGVH